MLRLIIIFALAIAVGLFFSRLFSNKRDGNVIDGELIDADAKPNKPKPSTYSVTWIDSGWGCLLCSARFGISVMGLLQKAIAFAIDTRSFCLFNHPKCLDDIFLTPTPYGFFDMKYGTPVEPWRFLSVYL